MRLLVLGGTVFLGRHFVDAALARGHQITLFTRGRHNPDLFPGVEKLRGDRNGDLSQLSGRRWDAVIDTSGSDPDAVNASAVLLSSAVEHYTYTSSVAVYADFPHVPGLDETAPLIAPEKSASGERGRAWAAAAKVLCEQAVKKAFGDRALIVRPGLLAGPHDPTDRFTYWPRRIARGGEVFAPGQPERQLQIIDARDLAAWALTAVETHTTGIYNATGPGEPLTMSEVLETCRYVTGGNPTFVWVEDRVILAASKNPMGECPLWMPGGVRSGIVSCSKATAAGLRFRPLAATARDTWLWDAARLPDVALRAGIGPEREAALLSAWRGDPPADKPISAPAPGIRAPLT